MKGTSSNMYVKILIDLHMRRQMNSEVDGLQEEIKKCKEN